MYDVTTFQTNVMLWGELCVMSWCPLFASGVLMTPFMKLITLTMGILDIDDTVDTVLIFQEYIISKL